jgi:hypothetical protein
VLRGYSLLGSGADTSLMVPMPSLMDVLLTVPAALLSVARSAALPCPLANLPQMPLMVAARQAKGDASTCNVLLLLSGGRARQRATTRPPRVGGEPRTVHPLWLSRYVLVAQASCSQTA